MSTTQDAKLPPERINCGHSECEGHPHVTSNLGIFGGRPIVGGIRVAVGDVLVYLWQGRTIPEIEQIYGLTAEQINDAIAFAHDVFLVWEDERRAEGWRPRASSPSAVEDGEAALRYLRAMKYELFASRCEGRDAQTFAALTLFDQEDDQMVEEIVECLNGVNFRDCLISWAAANTEAKDGSNAAFHRGVDAAKEAIRAEVGSSNTDDAHYYAATFINAIARKCGFDRATTPSRPTPDKACPHCHMRECECSEFDASPELGAQ